MRRTALASSIQSEVTPIDYFMEMEIGRLVLWHETITEFQEERKKASERSNKG